MIMQKQEQKRLNNFNVLGWGKGQRVYESPSGAVEPLKKVRIFNKDVELPEGAYKN
jgi:hypothetical protein